MDGAAGIPDWASDKFISADQVDGNAQPQAAATSAPTPQNDLGYKNGVPSITIRPPDQPVQQSANNIPDWATDKFIPADQVEGPQAAPAKPTTPAALPTTPPSFGQTMLDTIKNDAAPLLGAANSVANTGLGLAQGAAALAHAADLMPDDTYQAIHGGINDIVGMKDAAAQNYENGQIDRQVPYAIGNFLGEAGQFAATAEAKPFQAAAQAVKYAPVLAPKIAAKLASYVPSLGAGAVTAGAQPVQNESDRTLNAEIGAGAAGVGQAIGGVLSKQVTDPTKQAILQTAAENNIPVYRSQLSNSGPVRMVASLEKDVPFSGAGKKIDEQKSAFEDAVAKTIGQSGNVTPETLDAADTAIGNTYKEITNKYDLPVDKGFNDTFSSIRKDGQENLVGDKLSAFNQQLKNIRSKIVNASTRAKSNNTGIIPGVVYQNLRSNISGILHSSNSSPQMGKLLQLLDEKIAQSMTPEDVEKFGNARSMYRNMLVLEKVVKMDPNNPITPQRLAVAARNGFSDYAYASQNPLAKLARLGSTLRDTYPNSGTPAREQAFDIARHAIGPAVGIGLGGGEGYREGGWGGVLPGAAFGLAANKMAITPFLYSKMSANPSVFTKAAPAAGSAIADAFLNLHNQKN